MLVARQREADHVDPVRRAPCAAARRVSATGPLQAFQPARRKKSYSIDRPNVCCSPGSGISSARGARPAPAARALPKNAGPSARIACCSRTSPIVTSAKSQRSSLPHLAQPRRRRRQQIQIERLGRNARVAAARSTIRRRRLSLARRATARPASTICAVARPAAPAAPRVAATAMLAAGAGSRPRSTVSRQDADAPPPRRCVARRARARMRLAAEPRLLGAAVPVRVAFCAHVVHRCLLPYSIRTSLTCQPRFT